MIRPRQVRIALGTVQFGLPYGVANCRGQVSRVEAKSMLEWAAACGVRTLDTAGFYGDSEACLGEIGASGFRLVTKLPPLSAECLDVDAWVKGEVAASLRRLGTSEVYGLLLHNPGDLLGAQGGALYRALQSLKKSGHVRKVGISIYGTEKLEKITKYYKLDLVQAPFNLIDRRLSSSGWLHRLKESGVEIHSRSAFLQGLLLMRRIDIPEKFAAWSVLWNRWHQWLEDRRVSAVEACLAFPLSFPEIDQVVVGADSLSQLKTIIGFASANVADLPDLQSDEESLINPSLWRLR